MKLSIDDSIAQKINELAKQENLTVNMMLQRLINNFHVQSLQRTDEIRSGDLIVSEDELAQTRFRGLFEQSTDAIMLFDLNNEVFDFNQRALELLGYTPEEMLTLTVFDIIKRDDALTSMNIKTRLLQGETFSPYERIFLHKNGHEIPVEVNIECVFDSLGIPRYFQSITRDIRERKAIETRIRQSELRYQTVLQAMTEGIVIHDPDGSITLVNPAAEDLLGLSYEQMRGLTPVDSTWHTIHEDGSDFPGEEHPASISLSKGIIQSNVIVGVYKPDQTLTWLSVTSVPMKDSDGQITGVVATFFDITQLRTAQEQAVKLAVERERIAIVAKFIEAGSHEFRTPLSLIQTNTYLLGRRYPDDDKIHARLININNQVERITRLTERLFLMAKLDAMSVLKNNTKVRLKLLLSDIIASMTMIDTATTVELKLIDVDRPIIVESESDYLRHCFTEVLDNAMRHSQTEDVISLTVRLTQNEAYVTITDHGAGIASDDMPNIFKRFWRKDHAHSEEGFGLGLPIAQRIVELHHGTLTLDSTPTIGTKIEIYLPLHS